MTESVAPPPPEDSTVLAGRTARALWLGFWALVIQVSISVMLQMSNLLLLSRSTEAFTSWIRVSSGISTAVDVSVFGVLTLVALRVAPAPAGRSHSLALLAAVLFGVRGLLRVFTWALWLGVLELTTPQLKLFTWLISALYYASWGLLFVSIERSAKAWGFRFPYLPLVVAILLSAASAAAGLYWESKLHLPYDERPGDWFISLQSGLGSCLELALAAVFFISRTRLLRAREGAPPQLQRVSSPEWEAASKGLALYRGALLARVIVMVLGIPLLMAVTKAGEQEPIRLMLVIITLATLVCGIVSLVGLSGYTRVPESSGARQHARTALGLGLAGSVFDIWAIILVFRLAGGSVSAAFDYMNQAPWVEAGAQAAGLVALMFLTTSFHQAANALEDSGLASSAAAVKWVLGIAGGAGLLARLIPTTASSASALLVLAIPVACGLLVGVIGFVSLVGALIRAMQAGPVRYNPPHGEDRTQH